MNQNIRIRRKPRHQTRHMVVQHIRLLAGLGGSQQFAHGPALGCQHDAGRGLQAHTSAGIVDSLDGVLHLVEAALRGEGGGGLIVSTRHAVCGVWGEI